MIRPEERRQATRTRFVTHVNIRPHFSEQVVAGELVDISLEGMFVKAETLLEVDIECAVEVVIQGKNSRLVLDDIEAVVIRQDNVGFALRFTSSMEWWLLFSVYTQYAKQEVTPIGKAAERRGGMYDRRLGDLERRRRVSDRREYQAPGKNGIYS